MPHSPAASPVSSLNLAKIKAITLDLDDTLWPIAPTMHRAEAQLVAWLKSRAPNTADFMADPVRRLALREQVLRERPDLSHNLSAVREALIRQALTESDEDPGLAPAAFEVFFEARMQVQLYADATEALALLAQRFPVIALSNGNADVHRVGIGRYFKAAVSAHEFGVSKPDARIFEASARAAGVPCDEVLHVGDDAALDVLGALGANMQAAWINRNGEAWRHEASPHLAVVDMLALCQALGLR